MPTADYTFDGINKLIKLNNTGSVNVGDMFSRWKEWVLTGSNAGYLQAMRTVGGDPITETKALGSTYFLTNGWLLQPTSSDYTLTVVGNLYAEYTSASVVYSQDPISQPTGSYKILVQMDVSNLVDAISVQSSLEQSLEYQGQVIYDIEGVSGSLYPVGTYSSPVNNIAQAIEIANYYGFHKILLQDDVIIDNTLNISNKTFEGVVGDIYVELQSPISENTRFKTLLLTGSISGSKVFSEDCTLFNLSNINGQYRNCSISGSLYPASYSNLTLHDCFSSMAGTSSPIFNLSGSNYVSLSIRSYSGGIRFISGSDNNFLSTVEFIAGRFNIDPTVTNGFISVRGVAALNNTGTTATLETGSLINAASFANVTAAPDPVVATKVDELHQIHGLKSGSLLTVNTGSRIVGNITQSIVHISGSNQTTVERI